MENAAKDEAAKEEGELSDDDDVIIISSPLNWPNPPLRRHEQTVKKLRTNENVQILPTFSSASRDRHIRNPTSCTDNIPRKSPVRSRNRQRSRNRRRRNSINNAAKHNDLNVSHEQITSNSNCATFTTQSTYEQNASNFERKRNLNVNPEKKAVPSLLSLNIPPPFVPNFLLEPPPLPTIPPPACPEPPPLHLPPNSPRPRKRKLMPDVVSKNVADSLRNKSPPAGDVEDPDYIDLLLDYQQIRKQLAKITQAELSQVGDKNKDDKQSGDQTEGAKTIDEITANKGPEAGQGEGSFHDGSGFEDINKHSDKSDLEEEELDILQLRLNALKSVASDTGKVATKDPRDKDMGKKKSSNPRRLPFAPCSMRTLRSLPSSAKRRYLEPVDRYGNRIRPPSVQRRDAPRRPDVEVSRRRSEGQRRDDRRRQRRGIGKCVEEKKKQQVQYEMNQRRLEVQKILTLDDPKEQYTRFMELVAGVEENQKLSAPHPADGVVKDNYESVEMDLDSDVEPSTEIQTSLAEDIAQPEYYPIPGLDISPPKAHYPPPNIDPLCLPGSAPGVLPMGSDVDYIPAFTTDLGSVAPPTSGFANVVQSDPLYTDMNAGVAHKLYPYSLPYVPSMPDTQSMDVSDDDSTVVHHIPGLGWHNEPSDILKICEDHANNVTEQLQESSPIISAQAVNAGPVIMEHLLEMINESEDEEATLRAKLLKSLMARKKMQTEQSTSSGASSPSHVESKPQSDTESKHTDSIQTQAKLASGSSPSNVRQISESNSAVAKPKGEQPAIIRKKPGERPSSARQVKTVVQRKPSSSSITQSSRPQAEMSTRRNASMQSKTNMVLRASCSQPGKGSTVPGKGSPAPGRSSPIMQVPSPLVTSEVEIGGNQSPGLRDADVCWADDHTINTDSAQSWRSVNMKTQELDPYQYSHKRRKYYKVPQHKPVVIHLGDDSESEEDNIVRSPIKQLSRAATHKGVSLTRGDQPHSTPAESEAVKELVNDGTNPAPAAAFPGNLDSFLKAARKSVENQEHALRIAQEANKSMGQASDVPKCTVTTPEAIKIMPQEKIVEYKKLKERLQQSLNTAEVEVKLQSDGSNKAQENESNRSKQNLKQIDLELSKQRGVLRQKQAILDAIKREINKRKSILRMGEEHVQKLREQLAAAEKIVTSNRQQIEKHNEQAQDAQSHVDEKKARVQALEAQQNKLGCQVHGDNYKPGDPGINESNLKVTIGKGAQGLRRVALPVNSATNQGLSPVRKVVVVSQSIPAVCQNTRKRLNLDLQEPDTVQQLANSPQSNAGKQLTKMRTVVPSKQSGGLVKKPILREQQQTKVSRRSEMIKEKAHLIQLEKQYAELIRKHKESQSKRMTSLATIPKPTTMTIENTIPASATKQVKSPAGGGVWKSLRRASLTRRRTESIVEHVETEEVMEVTGDQGRVNTGGDGDVMDEEIINDTEKGLLDVGGDDRDAHTSVTMGDKSRLTKETTATAHKKTVAKKGVITARTSPKTDHATSSDISVAGASQVKTSGKILTPISLKKIKIIRKQHQKVIAQCDKKRALESVTKHTSIGLLRHKLKQAPASVLLTKDEMLNASNKPSPYNSYCSSLRQYRGYRLSPYFRTKAHYSLSSMTFSHQLNPNKMLCQFGLTGKCNDDKCPYQHDAEYQMSHTELLKDLAAYCPRLAGYPNSYAKSSLKPLDVFLQFFQKSNKCLTADEQSILLVSKVNEAGKRVVPHTMVTNKINVQADDTSISGINNMEESTSTDPPKHDRSQVPQLNPSESEVRYWSNDAVADMEAGLLKTPQDTKLWLKLAYHELRRNSNKEKGLNQALSVMARSLESNRSCSMLWLHYLNMYEQKRDSTDINSLYKQAGKYSPCFEIFWKHIQRTKSFKNRYRICQQALENLKRSDPPDAEDSHHILQVVMHMVALQVGLENFQDGLNLIQDAMKPITKSSTLFMDGLTVEDRLVIRFMVMYMNLTNSFPYWIYSPSGEPKDCPVYKDLLVTSISWDAIILSKRVRAQPKSADWCLTMINQCIKSFKIELLDVEDASSKHVWTHLHANETKLQILILGDVMDILIPLRNSISPYCMESQNWYIPIIEAATQQLIDGYDPQNNHHMNQLCEEALNLGIPCAKLCLAILNYKLVLGNDDSALELLENYVLSMFDSDSNDSATCDPNLLFCKLVGEPVPLQYKSPPLKSFISADFITAQLPQLWQCYCLLLELQGFVKETVDVYEAAILSVHEAKCLTQIWTMYLRHQYKVVLETKQSEQTKAYSHFMSLVKRCLTTLPARVPVPCTRGETLLDYEPHNTIVSMYLDTYPSTGDTLLQLYESLVSVMPHNVPLLLRAIEYMWTDGHHSLALGHCATALDVLPHSRELWIIYCHLLRNKNNSQKADPGKMRSVFQRATTYLPLDAVLWKDWALFELTEYNTAGLQYVMDRCTLPEADLESLVDIIDKSTD